MKFVPLILVFITILSTPLNVKAESHRLWYRQPADNWNAALPLGNGRLGAMVFGGTEVARFQLNEETLWAGEPGNNNVPEYRKALPEIRQKLADGKFSDAQNIANEVLPRSPKEDNNYGMPYQTLGELTLEFNEKGEVLDYQRELDIQSAIATTIYEQNDTKFTRSTFTDLNNDIMVIKLSANKPNAISFTAKLSSAHQGSKMTKDDTRLKLFGSNSSVDNKEGKVRFVTLLSANADSGEVSVDDTGLTVKKASTVTLLVSSATNFVNYQDISADPYKKALMLLEKAASKQTDEMARQHTNTFRRYFDTVSLSLGSGDSANERLPTDERLKNFNGSDLDFVSLYFQFGRYLLISSSQPGGQPANLQGIWNQELFPPWDSKYTLNINTEMNYWPANVTNLQPMEQPLFNMIEELSQTGQSTAEEMYGANGWVTHHNTDIWRITGPIDGAFYGLWPMGGAWLTQHIWQRYLFSGDRDFIAHYFPVLEQLVVFYLDILQPVPNTKYLALAPSMSPENDHAKGVSMAVGATMDNQLLFDVFSNYINGAEVLGHTSTVVAQARQALKRLPPMKIGKWGQLQEWMNDWDSEDDHHRHVSHLYGLYPGNQISVLNSPELAAAAKTSLLARGDISTGWSMGWKVNLWARLLEGNRAAKLISDQLSPANGKVEGESGGTYYNLLDAHPPFQIDGNFGCTAGIAEMLVQSHDGEVFLLPALPDNWKQGEVEGLLARGGFIIRQMNWQQGRLQHVVIESTLGGNLRLRTAQPVAFANQRNLEMASGTNANPLMQPAAIKDFERNSAVSGASSVSTEAYSLYDIPTNSGDVIRLTAMN